MGHLFKGHSHISTLRDTFLSGLPDHIQLRDTASKFQVSIISGDMTIQTCSDFLESRCVKECVTFINISLNLIHPLTVNKGRLIRDAFWRLVEIL